MRRADRAPPQHGHTGFRRMQIDVHVGNVVRQRARAFDRSHIDAVFHHRALERRAGENRLADDAMLPAGDVACAVEACTQRMHVRRAVITGTHVVLTRPKHLHRRAAVDRLRDAHGFKNVIRLRIRAATEAAARIQHVELHLLRLEARHFRHRVLIGRLQLLAVPDFARLRRQAHHAIERLHRRVREIRKFERRFERFRRVRDAFRRIAILAGDDTRLLRELAILREYIRRTERVRAAIIPLHAQRIAALLRGPEIFREYRNARRNLHDVNDARHLLRFRRVETFYFCAEERRMRDQRGEHVRQFHVDGELRAAVRLGSAVLARNALADQLEILRIFQFHIARHGLLCGFGGKIAKACALCTRLVTEHAVAHFDFGRRHFPFAGCCRHEHCTCRGTGLAQLLERIGERGAAARALRRAP